MGFANQFNQTSEGPGIGVCGGTLGGFTAYRMGRGWVMASRLKASSSSAGVR
jgi:hypothetical protein